MTDAYIGIGVLGAGWITRAHGLALRMVPYVASLGRPVQITMLGSRSRERGEAVAHALGVDRITTDWRAVVDDPSVHVVANLTGVGGHREATEAALALGKPVLCEKPLGTDRFEARAMAQTASRFGVPAVCGFNYRYLPAMRLARDIVGRGDLGRIVHFRGSYIQDYAAVTSPLLAHNGSRAVTDYAHIVDFLRYLGCTAEAVQATTAKLVDAGPAVEDAYVAAIDLSGGGIAALEATRSARGWKGRQVIEVNGTLGSLWWNMEDLNRLHVFYGADEDAGAGGFRDVLVTQPDHPYLAQWWPPGHSLGWEQSFVHQWQDFLTVVIKGEPLAAHQATFEDGYEAAVICDAILTSAEEGRRVPIAEMKAHVTADAPK